jgi:hypothetical protein
MWHLVGSDVVQGAHRPAPEPVSGGRAARIVGAHEEFCGPVVVRRGQSAVRLAGGFGQTQETVDPFWVGVAAGCQFGDLRDRRRADPLHPAVALKVQAQVVVEVVVPDGGCGAGAVEARR